MEGSLVHSTAIYQRTESGRIEIQLKILGLTQSERLVLIFVDGRMSLAELKEKMKGLESSRLERAIEKLGTKQLIFEVMMQDPSLVSDVLDAAVIDRFLQQDPLDPVTIVSFDAEYEYEIAAASHEGIEGTVLSAPFDAVYVLGPMSCDGITLNGGGAQQIGTESARPISSVDFYIPLEKTQLWPPNTSSLKKDAATIQEALLPQPIGVEESVSSGRGDLSYFFGGLLVAAGVLLVVFSVFLKIFP